MIGLIGGYGLEKILVSPSTEKHSAEFGDEIAGGKRQCFESFTGKISGKDAVVIPRHGASHAMPPHNVPYKSMLNLLRGKGVGTMITVNSVGILNTKIKRGSFILLSDFVNFGRELTFFDGFERQATHANMSHPYDRQANDALEKALAKAGVPYHKGAVYVNSHGPRLETAAEIRSKYSPHGDVIGMTGAYEAMLARELGMRIATLCLGVNYAEGLGESADFGEMKKEVQSMQSKLFEVLKNAVGTL